MTAPTLVADTSNAPVLSVSPIALPAPDRAVDLQVRVSAPVTGSELPIILLSHGHGLSNNLSSLNGYGPLANHWAARGFVVIQPTHLDSKTLSLDSADPEAPLHWRSRAEDMTRILDHLDPYVLSPGPKSLLTLFDAEHCLGGISGYDAAETTDENPRRVAAVQALTWAYLRSALYPGDSAWQTTCAELTSGVDGVGRIESK
ncbi:hypothetical protein FHG89_15705 [Micromonospora orduensis]|uniref:Chlorophyllase n=1 Tax=Micromonospora orduensis TaxID=1420891 RepID=A0A5C4QRK7_9ACTN|nr:hypothetical protein [Micromonospora orduensis]TNH28228.1 hypothetical protein FHG89_15705 [Micromonospora orduensis]